MHQGDCEGPVMSLATVAWSDTTVNSARESFELAITAAGRSGSVFVARCVCSSHRMKGRFESMASFQFLEPLVKED